jgi:uncharacterized protein YjbI with pentapeptide repeats
VVKRLSVKTPILPPELPSGGIEELIDHSEVESLHIDHATLTGVTAKGVTLETSHLSHTELSSCTLKRAQITDVRFESCLLFGTNMDGAGMKRVEVRQGVASGLVLSDALLEDVVLKGVKLNLTNWRVAKLRRVRFEDCDLTEADFQGAELRMVEFSGCNLGRAEFTNCKMSDVDLRGSDISTIKGITGLKGATIDPVQLMTISQPMAVELGLKVEAD